MTIKTKIIMMVLVAAVFTISAGGILYKTQKTVFACNEKEEVISTLSRGIFELNYLTNDFVNHPLDRALKQWHQKYSSLLTYFNKNKSKFYEELSSSEELERNIKELKLFFVKMSKAIETRHRNQDSLTLLYETKLSILAHNMVSKTEQLKKRVHTELITSHEYAIKLISLLFLLLSVVIVTISGLFFFGILKPVLDLTLGAEIIGKGNFDHKIPVKREDELGFLSKTFNEMSRQLKEITVHRSELETEILERKQAEQKTIESEDLFRTLFEQAGGYCMILEPTENGIPTIFDANQAACRVHGYTREELIGRPVADLDDEEGKRLCRERTKLILSGKSLAVENNHIRKDGSSFPVAVYANIVRFQGKPPLIVSTEFDISSKKESETEKRVLEKRLQQAQKMESIGTLAGGIAHDFNNLLFPIIGMAELLMEDFPTDSQEHDNVQEILSAGLRGRDLIRQIMTFSRQNEHKMMPVSLQQILKEVLTLCRSSIPSNIKITDNIQNDCSMVLADPTQIHQVGMNLITNAYHAVEPTGGEISISFQEVLLGAEEIKTCSLEPGRYALLSVADSGCGMTPDVKAKIFDPYFTTKEQGKGTGFGLSLVYGIIQEHNGEIIVESRMGKGSTFNVYVPLMDNSSDILSIENPVIEQKGNERILLVDDEEPIIRLEKLMLERLGYNVTTLSSSVDALTLFMKNPNEFDLIITDMSMPNMTGDILARKILSENPNVPIILCSGFSERMNKKQIETLGVKGLLMKPVIKSDMANMVRTVLDASQKL